MIVPTHRSPHAQGKGFLSLLGGSESIGYLRRDITRNSRNHAHICSVTTTGIGCLRNSRAHAGRWRGNQRYGFTNSPTTLVPGGFTGSGLAATP